MLTASDNAAIECSIGGKHDPWLNVKKHVPGGWVLDVIDPPADVVPLTAALRSRLDGYIVAVNLPRRGGDGS